MKCERVVLCFSIHGFISAVQDLLPATKMVMDLCSIFASAKVSEKRMWWFIGIQIGNKKFVVEAIECFRLVG